MIESLLTQHRLPLRTGTTAALFYWLMLAAARAVQLLLLSRQRHRDARQLRHSTK